MKQLKLNGAVRCATDAVFSQQQLKGSYENTAKLHQQVKELYESPKKFGGVFEKKKVHSRSMFSYQEMYALKSNDWFRPALAKCSVFR